MGALGNFLIGLLGSLVTFFTTYLTKKVAFAAAMLALFAGLFTAFFAAIQALLATISYSITNSWILTAMNTIWPAHVSVCISVCFTATILKWVYVETRERAKMVFYIT